MTKVPTGRQFVTKTPQQTPGTSRAKPVETPTLRDTPPRSTTPIINQAHIERGLSRVVIDVSRPGTAQPKNAGYGRGGLGPAATRD